MVLKARLHFLNEICKLEPKILGWKTSGQCSFVYFYNKHTFERKIYKSAGVLYGTKYSRMDQVKFVEDNL